MKASTGPALVATHSGLPASEIDEIRLQTGAAALAASRASKQALDCPTLE